MQKHIQQDPALHHRNISALAIQDLHNAITSGSYAYDSVKEIKSVLKKLFKLAGADSSAAASLPCFIVLPIREEKEVEPFSAKVFFCIRQLIARSVKAKNKRQ